MKLKENKNYLVILFFGFSILLILYAINVFAISGLVFWEIAYWIIPVCILVGIWSLKRIFDVRKEKYPPYKPTLTIFTLVVMVGFSIFAAIPFFYIYPVGARFDQQFKEKFGQEYMNDIPLKYRSKLGASGKYFNLKTLGHFFNKNVRIEKNIAYGDANQYQVMDRYEDITISGDKKPCLIAVHGGGSTAWMRKDHFGTVFQCRYFASLGFVAFAIEYTPAPIRPFPQGVRDVRTALAHIKSHYRKYNIDKEKIVMIGGSRGGHLATIVPYAGMNDNRWWKENGGNFSASEMEVACTVALYPVVDQFYGAAHGIYNAHGNAIVMGGEPHEREQNYVMHTVKNFVTEKCPPTLILHGSMDTLVSIQESRELKKKLDGAGIKSMLLEIPFGQHGFDLVPGTAGSMLAYYFVPRFVLLMLYGG